MFGFFNILQTSNDDTSLRFQSLCTYEMNSSVNSTATSHIETGKLLQCMLFFIFNSNATMQYNTVHSIIILQTL